MNQYRGSIIAVFISTMLQIKHQCTASRCHTEHQFQAQIQFFRKTLDLMMLFLQTPVPAFNALPWFPSRLVFRRQFTIQADTLEHDITVTRNEMCPRLLLEIFSRRNSTWQLQIEAPVRSVCCLSLSIRTCGEGRSAVWESALSIYVTTIPFLSNQSFHKEGRKQYYANFRRDLLVIKF